MNLPNEGQELQKEGIEKNVENDLAVNDEPDVNMALRRLLEENVGCC
jgi:hypothetical protein